MARKGFEQTNGAQIREKRSRLALGVRGFGAGSVSRNSSVAAHALLLAATSLFGLAGLGGQADAQTTAPAAATATARSAPAAQAAPQPVDMRRYNLPPQENGALLASLEARRRVLLVRVRQNPADLDAAFAYAQISTRMGDLEGAIATYERMLVRVPNTPRLQLELGALYYQLGAYSASRGYFAQVMARSDTPPAVRAKVDGFLRAMDGGKGKTGWTGQLSVGFRHHSNANAGPGGATVNLQGLDYILDDIARGTPDIAAEVGLSLGYRQPLPYRDVALQYDFRISASEFAERKDISSLEAEFRAGPVFALDRFGLKGGRFSASAVAGGGMLGGDPNYTNYGLSFGFQAPRGRATLARLSFDFRQEDYRSTRQRPRSDRLSGERYRLSGSLSRQFSANWQGFAGLGAERRSAEDDSLSYWEGNLQLGVSHRFDAPFEIDTDPWTLTAIGRIARRHNDAPNRVVSHTEKQRGTEYSLQLVQTVPLKDQLNLQVYGGYRSVRSNYDIRTFHDATFGASFVHQF